MRFVLLLGLKPVPWARRSASEREQIKAAVEAWYAEQTAAGFLKDHLRFETWKGARSVVIEGGVAKDSAGPFLAGQHPTADSVVVGLAVAEAKDVKAAAAIAKTWPVPDAAVEVRPLDERVARHP